MPNEHGAVAAVHPPWTLGALAITVALAIASLLPCGDDDVNVVQAAAGFDVATVVQPTFESTPPDPPTPAAARSPLERHAAMRDDIDPKPPLQLIDDGTQQHAADETIDLPARAMVDPDVSVRERASALFERAIAH